MRLNHNTIFAFLVIGTLPLLSGCNGKYSPAPARSPQPGTGAQTTGPVVQKCDAQRMALRKSLMGSLGIKSLQANSDKVMKQLTPDELDEIEKDVDEGSSTATATAVVNEDKEEITSIINDAITRAGFTPDSTSVVSGTTPVRIVHMGPDYIDQNGNFAVGSAKLQSITGAKVNDIFSVFLGVGLNTKNADLSFQTYSIGLDQVTDASTGATNLIMLSDYVETQLPAFCKGTGTALDPQTFNTIAVGTSGQN